MSGPKFKPTSIIKFKPLYGAYDEGALAYLLQVDDFTFLLDCGWDEFLDEEKLHELKRCIKQVDAILLSYPDVYHLGALPFITQAKWGLTCPVYATSPVYKMGQMFMYDLHQSMQNVQDFDLFTLDDVDAAFDRITQLKYSQPVHFKGKGEGLQILPLQAGHMIGGTIWKVIKNGEEEVIYAVDFNHKKERHLNGCSIDAIIRPNVLITDSFNAEYRQSRRSKRDEQLLDNILDTLRNNGNVLVTVDTAGRVLELIRLLETMWSNPQSGLQAYSLALLNNVSYNVLEFAKSQVEWMSDKIIRGFEDKRNNPFQSKHLQLCHSVEQLDKIPDPKVVLASGPDLESGFSRELFLRWCGAAKNTVILTTRTTPRTLARILKEDLKEDLKGGLKTPYQTLTARQRVKLTGEELSAYMANQKKDESTTDRVINGAANGKEEEDSSESEDEEEGGIVHVPGAKQVQHDLVIKGEGRTKTGFFQKQRKSYAMFPYVEEKLVWDDYGEVIRLEDFIDPVEAEPMDQTEVEAPVVAEPEKFVPTKCVERTREVEINCKVFFIDFEGRSDGESVKKLLEQIRPKQLILVHGLPDTTKVLAEYCRLNGLTQGGSVYSPLELQLVDATTESSIYQVKLKDSLVSQLKFVKNKDAEVAWVDGQIKLHDESEGMKEEGDDEITPMLLGPPILEKVPASRIRDHAVVYLGEPKLSDFKMVLTQSGLHAEFSRGALVINERVAVRKNESGRIQLEGCVSDDYFKVRDLLYEQYAIV